MVKRSANAGSAGNAHTLSIAKAVAGAVVLLFTTVSHAIESEIDHLAEVLQLEPGSGVADGGAGSGEVSIAIAKHVRPHGTVYATEIDPTLLERIRGAVQNARADNVVAIAAAVDTGCPATGRGRVDEKLLRAREDSRLANQCDGAALLHVVLTAAAR